MSEVHGSVGSYVANALDPDERSEFEQHLAVCPSCAREVREFAETAAELGILAQSSAPPQLRASVLGAIQQVRPLPPVSVGARSADPAPAGGVDAVGPVEPTGALSAERVPAGSAREGSANPVDELALRRQRRTARLLSFTLAAAMVVALAMGGWVVNLVQQRRAEAAAEAVETQLWSAPDVKVYPKAMPDGTQVSFVVSKSLDKAMFVGADIADPGENKVYKLWRVPAGAGAAPIGDATFGGGKPQQVWLTGGVSDAAALAVSVEQDPNTPTPTTDPVAVAL